MAIMKPTALKDIIFEPKDIEIFKIPDTKTRIATVQNYFFPRLELLLRHTLDLVQEIYEVNPYERMTFVYCPSNRKSARLNADFDWVHIGLSGKRRTDRELTIKRKDGKAFFHHPTYLTFNIELSGALSVELMPFRQDVDSGFISAVARLYQQNIDALSPIFGMNFISHNRAKEFIDLKDVFIGEKEDVNKALLFSPFYYFPVDAKRGLGELVMAFASLYPLLDSFISIGEGESARLPEMLDKFKSWYLAVELEDENEEDEHTEGESADASNMPEMDSYTFVRAGLWWSVLARDNWTCCSCGRSSKEEGITLEVDHITPRSKGGTDDLDNLQTLCKKCNIGKSNKDNTDLRHKVGT
jgi:HNH endonuclease